MSMQRIKAVEPLDGFKLKLTLTDGSVIERDVSRLLVGKVFEPLLASRTEFCRVRAEAGTVVWENGADLCPDVLIWGGPPPQDERPGIANPPVSELKPA
ncbi:MAG TPA: DUF2442 domain-containing protein [Candidatus Latescibacteria bacterium]|nr:DUF2442 domain-containing protein [Candidatus Latescibacterota bacterium]HOT36296.1 DUF2442 domain-containing protein [Candidatus Latescibacterota bacterium]HPC44557.1 DUF2442 domain-containing protein [Candidatus Latescibacterota bacterium]HPK75382.1 DUF2442 domain-containing protein [Candidatus Latescibacterota bacterium]HQK22455.1 DUF2442 domain-containing protein [Candidatus Latescibacterota bacterium]